MEFVKCYQDLCREIEIYEERLKSLIVQKDAIVEGWLNPISDISGIDYTKPKVDGGKPSLDMAEQLSHITAIENDIEKYQTLLLKIKVCKKSIEEYISNMQGVEYKLLKLKIIENKNLKEIAEILNYSYSYTRRLYSEKIKKLEGI